MKPERKERKSRDRLVPALLYFFIALVPVVVSESIFPENGGPAARLELDILLVALPVLALQPVLAARLRPADRAYGFNNVIVFHKIMGMTAATLMVCVPLLRTVATPDRASLAAGSTLAAAMAAALLVLTALTSLMTGAFRLTFERWRTLHNTLALLILASAFACGFIRTGAWANRTLLAVLFLAAVSAWVYHKVLGPGYRKRHAWTVTEVRKETDTVRTIRLEPPGSVNRFDFFPGQFQFITIFGNSELPEEEHHFTISSSPVGAGFVESTVKESGDYTRALGRLRPGASAAVQAPFGDFSFLLHPGERRLLFVAGGIGITPLMSMLRYLHDTDSVIPVTLLYANRTEEDIVFRDQLGSIEAGGKPALRVVHVLSRADERWTGERGRIGREIIGKYLDGDAASTSLYVCGPPAMTAAVIRAAYEIGFKPSRIHSERFAL